jgi:hypothetical protein
MFDLIKIFITFLLTGCVGVFISYRIQRKQIQTQLFFKKAEKKAIELKETRDRFEDLSGERIYRSKTIITSLKDNTITEKEREDYQLSVVNWNKKLNTLYFDLSGQQLYYLAIQIENEVHNELALAHLEIKKEINKKTVPTGSDLDSAMRAVNRAYENARLMTKEMTFIADSRWDEIKTADSLPLSYHNLEQASTLTLIRALFHSSPHRLRINRSRFDN